MSANLAMMAEAVRTREDLIAFLTELQRDLKHPDEWENPSLDRYLEAMTGWLEDLEGFFLNRREPMPAAPDWRLVARLLYAGRSYE